MKRYSTFDVRYCAARRAHTGKQPSRTPALARANHEVRAHFKQKLCVKKRRAGES